MHTLLHPFRKTTHRGSGADAVAVDVIGISGAVLIPATEVPVEPSRQRQRYRQVETETDVGT